jgi:hypothetical protein
VEGADAGIAAGPLGLLRGDAGLRAIYAWHMGWPAARQAAGESWLAPFLARTLDDPYAVVRYIGGRSLRTLGGFAEFRYDFLASTEQRQRAAAEVLRLWSEARRERGVASAPADAERNRRLLLDAQGALNLEAVQRLLEQRDQRPMLLGE